MKHNVPIMYYRFLVNDNVSNTTARAQFLADGKYEIMIEG